MASSLTTHEELRRLLRYDSAAGTFIWRVDIGKMKAGDTAGSIDHEGYRIIGINGRRYRAHRLAWMYVHGFWPDGEVDHKNGNTSDNRITNLRCATTSQNGCNRGRQRNNKSGHKGVSWHKAARKWTAHLYVKGVRIYLGYFADLEGAAEAYAEAALKHHGEFACVRGEGHS